MYEPGNPADPAGYSVQAAAPGSPVYDVPPGTYPPQMPGYVPTAPMMPPPGYAAPPMGYALPAYAGVNQPSAEVAALRAQLEREQMKNDLRVEMQTAAKLAALEAAAKNNPGVPMVLNNNNSGTNMQAAGAAAPGGAPTTVIVVGPQRRERFCGPLS